MAPHRICILGTTGSGKTTLARKVAEKLGIPRIELDALNWEANWTQASNEVFRERVAAAVAADSWVMDGNYRKARDLTWTRATTIVWLDYPPALTFTRLFRRTMRRMITREMIWGHSQESWRNTFLSRDSLFLWFVKTYGAHRQELPDMLAQPDYQQAQIVRIRRPSEADDWLAKLV